LTQETGGIIRVMIVEDDRETLARFGQSLARDPSLNVIATAWSGRDALARLGEVEPDVLLVDLGLPDMHGTEVIRQARRLHPECDIMVISLFGDEHNVLASIEAGATGYILKDCTDEDLVQRVRELRAGGAPMTPVIARMVLQRMRLAHPPEISDAAGAGERGPLTSREIEVLGLLARGYVYAEIAERLGISLNTVASHIKNSYRKLAVHSGAAAVTRAAELGLLRPGPKASGF
jgi:DNA-binding NarL/FixJ family response regulator